MDPLTFRISSAALAQLEEAGIIVAILSGAAAAAAKLWQWRQNKLKNEIIECLATLTPAQLASAESIAAALKRKPVKVRGRLLELLAERRVRRHPGGLWSL